MTNLQTGQIREWPSVSIAIPTFNSVTRVRRCLQSVFAQKYPSKIEVLVVDEGSTDGTLDIVREFPVRLLQGSFGGPEIAKMAAFRNATGELFFYLDDDNELTSSDWISKMAFPLIDDASIVGSFTHQHAAWNDPDVIKYLSYDKLQRDPFLAYFSIGIEETFVESRPEYTVCRFTPARTPPQGLLVSRQADIQRILESDALSENRALDIDLTAALVARGRVRFAYVSVGIIHHFADSFKTLIKKRVIHVKRGFLASYPNRRFVWAATSDKDSMKKMVKWIVISNSILPLFISGFRKYRRLGDPVLLLEPLVGLVLTDAAYYAFLTDPRGRRVAFEGLKGLVGR
ncbi:MAG: glycosyltransferase family 2 protein [Nitrososphaerota archaeon]|nr:glycosyltransferase family 2 protein [Nitrososphaerota archaeon]